MTLEAVSGLVCGLPLVGASKFIVPICGRLFAARAMA